MRRVAQLLGVVVLALTATLSFGTTAGAGVASSSWTPADSKSGHTELTGTFFISPREGWLVGGEHLSADENVDHTKLGYTVVRHTTDGGKTWLRDAGSKKAESAANKGGGGNHELKKVFFVGNRGWIIGEASDSNGDNVCNINVPATQSVILFTSDRGKSWVRQASNTCGDLEDLYMVSGSTGYITAQCYPTNCIGSDQAGVLKTTDGGSHWNFQPFGLADCGEAPNAFVSDGISFPERETGYVVDNDCILKTTDGGVTWKRQTASGACDVNASTNTCGIIEYVTCVDAGRCWASVDSDTSGTGYVLRLNGNSWTAYPVDTSANVCKQADMDGILFFDDDNGLVFGEDQCVSGPPGVEKGMMFRTTDGGKTWTPETLPAGTGQLVHGRVRGTGIRSGAAVVGQGGTVITLDTF